MKLEKGLPVPVLNELFREMLEFDLYLEDTRENVEAPTEQLSPQGRRVQRALHANGIRYRQQVDWFAYAYLRPLISPDPLSLARIKYIEKGLEDLIGDMDTYPDLGLVRVIDLTAHTDDPGNTEALVAFIPFRGNDEGVKFPSQEEMERVFHSMGDHVAEVIITMQNNEFMLLFNFNK